MARALMNDLLTPEDKRWPAAEKKEKNKSPVKAHSTRTGFSDENLNDKNKPNVRLEYNIIVEVLSDTTRFITNKILRTKTK